MNKIHLRGKFGAAVSLHANYIWRALRGNKSLARSKDRSEDISFYLRRCLVKWVGVNELA